MEWKEISIAPRDGTPIIGCCVYAIMDERPLYSVFDCEWRAGKWRSANHFGVAYPTHWIPFIPPTGGNKQS